MKPLISVLAACALAAPIAAVSALLEKDGSNRAPDAGKPAAAKPAEPRPYMLRCWQYGHLLFEEPVRDLPGAGVRYRFQSSDAERSPVYVLETGSATCLIKRRPEPNYSGAVKVEPAKVEQRDN